ncbi:hypothetical protein [Lysobacter sp. CA196]|uniref:hypothetical protein n=1 Tax=Lysobacter sp. CA196 TaxID=3455606 RepID=UPI003F8D03A2
MALLIAAGVAISLYCLRLTAAAWPGWQDDVRTGPWGMTAQAASLHACADGGDQVDRFGAGIQMGFRQRSHLRRDHLHDLGLRRRNRS